MADHDFHAVVRSAAEKIAAGATVYQKFTCSSCGNRLTMDVPNTFFTHGTCDKCDHETNIEEAGHNYLMVMQREVVAAWLDDDCNVTGVFEGEQLRDYDPE
jgi:hypothetical protein